MRFQNRTTSERAATGGAGNVQMRGAGGLRNSLRTMNLAEDGAAMLSSCDIDDEEWLDVIGSTIVDVALKAGSYRVSTATWEPDDATNLQLVRIQRTS